MDNLSRDLDNADAIAEVRFYDNMREALRQGNLSEPEQRRQALSLSLTAKNQYETLKEMGTYGGGLADFLNENYQRFTVADRADTRATLNNGQMTKTPARMSNEEMEEAWAEYQERNRPQMTDEEREFFEERPSRKLYSLGDNETDYVEYKGNPEGAIEKLLQEKSGYVSGAIYKDGIGAIDFIYGKSGKDGYGLAHIIERRNQQGINGEEFVREIPEIIRQGVVYDILGANDRKYILSNNKEAVIRLDWDGEQGNWLLTAYIKKSRALPALRTSSGQIYLDEPITSSNPASENNISSDTENVNNKLFSKDETVRGAYDPETRVIEIFADARP